MERGGGGNLRGAEGTMLLVQLQSSTTGTPVPWPLQEDTGHSASHPPPRALALAGDICDTKVLTLESYRGLGMF